MTQPTFRTPKSAQTFEKVLRVATEQFRTKGYHNTTMRDLAKESGMGLGALYYYFRSKEELVLRFYEHSSQESLAIFRSLPEPPQNLADGVLRFTRLKIEHLTPYRELLRVVMKEAVDPASTLSVFHPNSAVVLTNNVGLLQEMVELWGVERGTEALEMARALWMGQMAILAYWLHDRSPNYAATERAIETLGQLVRFSSALRRIPGFGALRQQGLAIISNLFQAQEQVQNEQGKE